MRATDRIRSLLGKRERVRRGAPWFAWFVVLSVVVHVFLGGFAWRFGDALFHPTHPNRRPITLVLQKPTPKPDEPPVEAPEPPKPDFHGQIVEVSPPDKEETPDQSDYLSEYDAKTDHETRTEKFTVNPEVLAREYSKEMHAEQEQPEVEDLNVTKPSTGASVGNHRFDPDRDGTMAALPSPWQITNKLGTADPIPASRASGKLSGSPQNDLLDEDVGKYVDLNTTRYPYAGYIDRIRRQVNYWWQQNLDNLPSSVRLSKSRYTTVVAVVLNADGGLDHLEVQQQSGSPEIDDCLVRAFRVAAPFENPPAGLIEKDGRVYLPEFDFTLGIQAAQMQYQGVDPRAGVQFPGILRSPR